MAIAYPLTMPGAPGFQASRFRLIRRTAVFESAFTGAVQTLERPGAMWAVEYALPPMPRGQAAAWLAFVVALRGRVGTFKGFDPDARSARGVATGTPLVKGAGQTGNSLATDGWTPSVTGILKAGDYLGLALPTQRLHLVVEDATSDGAGNATLSIEPALRESPNDNAILTTTNPFTQFRLAADDAAWDADRLSVFGLTFQAIEAL
ncbi:MAG: hypothetical protein ACREER_09535 [Alphaproteobacteria bacterium]